MVESDQSSLLASCQPVEQVPEKWHGEARTPGNLTPIRCPQGTPQRIESAEDL
jgi:hypothetical protein